jgi:hypothetical protein
VLLATLLATAVIAQAGAPVATTGTAGSVSTTGAVVAGTVDPNGSPTTYQVEYGTTSSYGLQTEARDAGAGDDPVTVSVPLTGLTSSTTYHFRVVATNAAGTSRGEDRTVRTAAVPRPPAASTSAARSVTGTAATLAASVNPRGLATNVQFEYGTSTAYGSVTPVQSAGSGSATRTITRRITGLRANTRYHVRVVATNAAGTVRGANRTFTTSRVPTGITVTASTRRPVWGTGVTLRGRVRDGARVSVALQRQRFPFTEPFAEVARATADADGDYTLRSPALYGTSRLRVVTRGATVVTSAVTTASVAVRVGLRTERVGRSRMRLAGAIWPAVPAGRVSLQRRTASGRYVLVRRVAPRPLSGNRSRYALTLRRPARARTYRVVVVARDGGEHVPGTSRTVRLAPRR